MKIVYMGTPEFAVPALERIVNDGHDIRLVVTQPDRPGNRGKVKVSPIKERAQQLNLEVAQPYSVKRDDEFVALLKEIAPDMIVVAAFGQILPEKILDIPLYGCINIHGSLLPKLRGASPMQTAILEGMSETGVTIMKMDKGLDTGDIIAQQRVSVEDKNIETLSSELADAGAELLSKTILEIESGEAKYQKQNDDIVTYSYLIKKEDGFTDFSGRAEDEERKIRAYRIWPGMYSSLNGKTIKFYSGEVIEGETDYEHGTVSSVDKRSFTIDCGNGRLKILELQMQGKKRLSAEEFLRGSRLRVGDRFSKEV